MSKRPSIAISIFLSSLALLGCGGSSSSDGPAPDAGTGGGNGGADAAPPPVTSITFTEAGSFTIVDAGKDHLAFPDVTRLSDGRILLVYRRGAGHVDASGRIMKQLGSADGKTWTDAEVLYDEPGVDDRDPSVATLSNGDVVVNYFQYRTLSTPDGNLSLHQNFFTRSTDDGATFSPIVKVGSGPMDAESPALANGLWVDGASDPIEVDATSSAVVELGGRLLMPNYGGKAVNLSNLAAHPKSRLSLYASGDGGATWSQEMVAPDLATDLWLMEPAVLPLGGDRLLMHVRTAKGASPGAPGDLLQTVSEDGGATWSEYRDLGFIGHAPELLLLQNGVLLSAFREINDAYTKEWVSFMYSLDGGATWSERIRVRDCGAVECGYPGLSELEGNKVLVVYYAPGGVSVDAAIYGFVTGS